MQNEFSKDWQHYTSMTQARVSRRQLNERGIKGVREVTRLASQIAVMSAQLGIPVPEEIGEQMQELAQTTDLSPVEV